VFPGGFAATSLNGNLMEQKQNLVGSPCGPDGVIWEDGICLPQGIIDPTAPWIFDIVTPALAAVLLIIIFYHCARDRTLTWSFLIAIASATTWWLETFGDWAQHLLYSPVLHHYTLDWWYAAPHNPVLMPVTYALYWWAHAWAILRLAELVLRKWPALTLGQGILILSLPVTFLWNLVIEGAATYLGWWTYDPPIGPAIAWERGTFWPLTWPVCLMIGWINLIAWMVGLPEEQDRLNRLDRFMGLHRLLARVAWLKTGVEQPEAVHNPALGNWKFQIVRLLSWIVFFNITFALTLNLPLFLMRMIPAFHSYYLPMPW
jgi:hypothetical protein